MRLHIRKRAITLRASIGTNVCSVYDIGSASTAEQCANLRFTPCITIFKCGNARIFFRNGIAFQYQISELRHILGAPSELGSPRSRGAFRTANERQMGIVVVIGGSKVSWWKPGVVVTERHGQTPRTGAGEGVRPSRFGATSARDNQEIWDGTKANGIEERAALTTSAMHPAPEMMDVSSSR